MIKGEQMTQTKELKMTPIIAGFISTIIVTVIFLFLAIPPYNHIQKTESAYKSACNELGYEAKTGYRLRGNSTVSLECDNKMVGDFLCVKVCTKTDKWKDCIKEELRCSKK